MAKSLVDYFSIAGFVADRLLIPTDATGGVAHSWTDRGGSWTILRSSVVRIPSAPTTASGASEISLFAIIMARIGSDGCCGVGNARTAFGSQGHRFLGGSVDRREGRRGADACGRGMRRSENRPLGACPSGSRSRVGNWSGQELRELRYLRHGCLED